MFKDDFSSWYHLNFPPERRTHWQLLRAYPSGSNNHNGFLPKAYYANLLA